MTVITNRVPTSEGAVANQIRLRLLGGFDVLVDGRSLPVCDSTRRVIVYLALHRGPQPRAVLAGTLWPEKSEARAGANLRSCLWRLHAPDGLDLVHASGAVLQLAPHVVVDIDEVQANGWALVRDRTVSRIAAIDRDALFADLLPGWYEDWILIERERLMQLWLHFLESLVEVLAHAGRHAEAVDTALRLVSVDPLRERSHLVLIAAFGAEGSRGRAQQQYDEYRALLVETFGCLPDVTFADALKAFRTHDTVQDGA